MKPWPFIVLLALGGCGASQQSPMPLAASGPSEVMVDGAAFMADLEPVPEGARLSVMRQNGLFALDEGVLAKKVAVQFCADRGQSFDKRALGSFTNGLWFFDGGCE